MGIDPGQDLLDGGRRRAIVIGVAIVRCRQGPCVEFAVDRHRQRVDHQYRGRHHVGRQLLGELSAYQGRIGGSRDIPDEMLGPAAVLTGDHGGLFDTFQTS
ncbi:hypothetical protein NJB14192_24240 [Mycobacterium montefiorense]|nr:hypothetical protein NJB14192_24240 [Mycobacterium montefiorense]